MTQSIIKFSKKTKSTIWKYLRGVYSLFGMWIEIQQRIMIEGPNKGLIYTNRLRLDDDDSDLHDYISWDCFCDYKFEMINGHILLDIPVHDHEELKDNCMLLLREDGTIIGHYNYTSDWELRDFIEKYQEPKTTES